MPNRTVFFVSDGTGITAETFGNSILAQFAGQAAPRAPALHRHGRQGLRGGERDQPTAKRGQAPDRLHHPGQRRGARIVTGPSARAWCWTCSAPSSSRWRRSSASRATTAWAASPTPAKSQEYNDRIEAINFSLAHDDGQSARNLAGADVILVGVSRSGKTPTSAVPGHAARHQGGQLPADPRGLRARQAAVALAPYKRKCFGLTIDPDRLAQIRNERRPAASTPTLENCRYEVNEAER
jgi:regulator of PEP synthase PpsR (kinase-PPPase family)